MAKSGATQRLESDMSELVHRTRRAFRSGRLRTYEQRRKMLVLMDLFFKEQEEAILEACKQDTGKTYTEVQISEIYSSRAEISFYLKNLKSFMKPTNVAKGLLFMQDKTRIQPQPYGVVLLIVPWNYPFYLLFTPLVGAIAAGNCVVIKPSEVSVASEKLIQTELNQYLPADCFPVVCGGAEETTALLTRRFDYIFFTGATNIGRIVMKAAAEHITPVTLELGGKSPTFVDESSDMQLVANRILASKSLNAGQACISHDYILCTPETETKLVDALKVAAVRFFGKNMQESDSYARIINTRHFDRIMAIKERTKGRIVIDGGADRSDRFIGLTVITDIEPDDSMMEQEIFGPLMGIITVKTVQEAIDYINAREKPLVSYVFSNDQKVIDTFEQNTTSGAMVANDSAINMAINTLPFGGVGQSGIGAYHGKLTFDTFSHHRAVMIRKQAMEVANVKMRYPPFNKTNTHRLCSLLFTTEDSTSRTTYGLIALAVVGAVVAVGMFLYRQ